MQAPPAVEAIPAIRSTSRLVLVDVTAVDKHGTAVTGLTKDDFVLEENGVTQAVSQFDWHGGPSGPAAKTDAVAATGATEYSNEASVLPGEPITIILLDALNSTVVNRSATSRHLVTFLRSLPKGRRVGLYALGSELRLVQPYTGNSEDLVQAALQAMGGGTSLHGGNDKQDIRNEIAVLAVNARGTPAMAAVERMKQFLNEDLSNRTDTRVAITVTAMRQLARSLAGVPGRKNLIWLSEGFPTFIDPDEKLLDPARVERSYVRDVQEAAAMLAQAQIAIFPVDIAGLTVSPLQASVPGPGAYDEQTGVNITDEIANQNSDQLGYIHHGMDVLAQRTGGKAFYNSNDFGAALQASLVLGSSYYTLAYRPGNENWNGRFRKIRVKTTRKGVRLIYRTGYYAVGEHALSDAELNAVLADALRRDLPESTMLRMRVSVQAKAAPSRTLTITYVLDPAQVKFVPSNGGPPAALLQAVAQCWDADGRPDGAVSGRMAANLGPPFVQFQQEIELNPEVRFLRVAVADQSTGRVGSVDLPLPTTVDGGNGSKR